MDPPPTKERRGFGCGSGGLPESCVVLGLGLRVLGFGFWGLGFRA